MTAGDRDETRARPGDFARRSRLCQVRRFWAEKRNEAFVIDWCNWYDLHRAVIWIWRQNARGRGGRIDAAEMFQGGWMRWDRWRSVLSVARCGSMPFEFHSTCSLLLATQGHRPSRKLHALADANARVSWPGTSYKFTPAEVATDTLRNPSLDVCLMLTRTFRNHISVCDPSNRRTPRIYSSCCFSRWVGRLATWICYYDGSPVSCFAADLLRILLSYFLTY